jgi:histidinol-phosphate aminotransferase
VSVVSSTAAGPPPGMRVRLSSNESPYGPSPAAMTAAREVAEDLHLYPDDQSVQLREALAEDEGVAFEAVSSGTGSAAILMDLVPQQTAGRGGNVVAYERAFIVYRLAARNAGVEYREAPTGGPATGEQDGYGRDPQALLDSIDDDTRVVIVDNPGNPTGAHLDADGLRAVVEGVPEHVTLLVDEAYWQYAAGQGGYARVRDLDVDHPRLIVAVDVLQGARPGRPARRLPHRRPGDRPGGRRLAAAVQRQRRRPGGGAGLAARHQPPRDGGLAHPGAAPAHGRGPA